MKRFIPFFCFFLLITLSAQAENYLINGGQESSIKYTLAQHIEPAGETKTLKLSFVVPESFNSPTYKQRIENFQLNFSPDPSKQKEEEDQRCLKFIQKKKGGDRKRDTESCVMQSARMFYLVFHSNQGGNVK